MLRKIISGGQTGAQQASLDAAIKYRFPHGGWIPKGRKTEDGRLPDNYNLKEMPTYSYPKRTEQNIIYTDGTVIICHGRPSGGSRLTKELAKKHNRPCLYLDLNKTPAFIASSKINSWIIKHNVQIMNVAGSRASKDPKIYEIVKYIIEGVILLSIVNAESGAMVTDYSEEAYLEKPPVLPKTVDEAVDRLISDLDLEARIKITKMSLDELVNLHTNLHVYFKNAFGLWSGNKELLEDCRSISNEPINNEDDATFVILEVLWQKLQDTHKLRVVK